MKGKFPEAEFDSYAKDGKVQDVPPPIANNVMQERSNQCMITETPGEQQKRYLDSFSYFLLVLLWNKTVWSGGGENAAFFFFCDFFIILPNSANNIVQYDTQLTIN